MRGIFGQRQLSPKITTEENLVESLTESLTSLLKERSVVFDAISLIPRDTDSEVLDYQVKLESGDREYFYTLKVKSTDMGKRFLSILSDLNSYLLDNTNEGFEEIPEVDEVREYFLQITEGEISSISQKKLKEFKDSLLVFGDNEDIHFAIQKIDNLDQCLSNYSQDEVFASSIVIESYTLIH